MHTTGKATRGRGLKGAVEFLKKFRRYWQTHKVEEEMEIPLKRVAKALQLATEEEIEWAREWASEVAWHVTLLDDPLSLEHKHLWKELNRRKDQRNPSQPARNPHITVTPPPNSRKLRPARPRWC
jgi:hypothetical protein